MTRPAGSEVLKNILLYQQELSVLYVSFPRQLSGTRYGRFAFDLDL
jgi:hypothetical protein